MNSQQARTLVAETFPKPFDKYRFRQFVKELLNKYDEDKAQSMAVPQAFAEHVRSCSRLGTYKSQKDELLDILIVRTTEDWKLERTRTALRDFVAHKLKRGDNEKDAALVAFVSPTENKWRFSYVKMEYAAKIKSGKVYEETKLTPARRFSYIVGEGESCYTAQSRFLTLLQDTENLPSLAQIEEAFSVEAVTKEFFKQYASLFSDIEAALQKLTSKDKTIGEELKKKKVSTVDFAKKLLGQIVFLYFLQKKGWLGVEKGKDWGTGPHDFLRRLACGEYGLYRNFFNDILEPLFYDTLATDRGHEAWCQTLKCRIPFLNGGLFEPLGDYDWHEIDITLPNKLFTNTERNDIGDIGTGVLDIFDRYNFTVNEAEPLENEVAIDPEMLGKVFENLIEENRRKGLGSYYTPREIVHYMCRESLISYLDSIVNKPKEKVPRTDLETYVNLGDQISHYEAVDTQYVGREMPKRIKDHARLIDDKLADITVCDPAVGSGAFPVGMMTEIVRARSALTPYFNDIYDRTSYNFKRHAIQNCLYGVDIDPGAVEIAKLRLWLSLVVDEHDVKQIKPLPNLSYKIVTGNSLMNVKKNLFNKQFFRQLEELKPRYFDEPNKEKKDCYKQQIEETILALTNGKETFDFEIYFSEVFHKKGGFDVTIGNPPYVSYGLRGGQSMSKEEKDFLKSSFPDSAEYKISLYAVFMERGIRLAHRARGIISFIVPDSFILGMYFSKIRNFILRECDMNYILLLPFSVFKAVVGFSVVYQFSRRESINSDFCFTARTAPSALHVGRSEFKQHSYSQNYFFKQKRNKFRLFFDPQTKALVEKCLAESILLESLVAFRSGLIGKEGKDAIISKIKVNGKWRPGIISGGEIERYSIMPEGNYLLYDPIAIKSGYESVEYFKPKLFMRQTGDSLICAIDDKGLLCLNNVHVGNIISQSVDLRVLAALLNSKLLNWYYQTIALEVGRVMPQTDIETIDDLPIRPVLKPESLIKVVDCILAAKSKDIEADVSRLEREIDKLVYMLYGLTPEEIRIVESSVK